MQGTAPSELTAWVERPLPLATPDLASLAEERAALLRVARALRDEGYATGRIAGLADVSPAELLAKTHLYSIVLDERLRRSDDCRELLAALFLFGGDVDADRWARRVPPELRALLERLKLVVVRGGGVVGAVSIVELAGRLFFADKLFEQRNGRIQFYANDDLAMPPHYSSLALLAHARPQGRSLLDVGCGAGCLSVLLSHRFHDVTAIDIGARSVWFTLLNADVNDVRLRCERQDGLAFSPGRRYDGIVFNTPSEVGYAGGSGFRHQGDSVLRRFIRTRLPELLAPGGTCLMWGILGVCAGDASIEQMVASYLGHDPRYTVSAAVDPRSPFSLREANVERRRVPLGSWALRDRKDEPLFWEHLDAAGVRAIVTATIEIRAEKRRDRPDSTAPQHAPSGARPPGPLTDGGEP